MDFFGQNFELLVFEDKVFEQMPKFFIKPIGRNRLQQLPRTKGRREKESKGKSFAPSKRKIEMKENSLENKSYQKGLFVCGSFKIQVIF
jgi:hypothetical protein